MKKLILPIGAGLNEMHDESLFAGCVHSRSEPKNAQEVCKIVKMCIARGEQLTVCGGLTGLNGAGVPAACHSMNTKYLCDLAYNEQNHTVCVGSGTPFSQIESFVLKQSKKTREFPVSPTEKTATIGGALSFGSTGLRSFRLGSVSSFVEEIEYCNASGELHILTRGDKEYDLFLGSEGMMGILTRITLKTIERKPAVWGIMFFFPDEVSAATFSDRAAYCKGVEVLEYIDKASFVLCEAYKQDLSILAGIPSIPEGQSCGIFIEIHAENDDEVEGYAETLMNDAVSCKGDPDLAWAMVGDEVEKLRNFRHAIAECINIEVSKYNAKDARIKKLIIDIRWIGKSRAEILKFYRKVLQDLGLRFLIYGHLGTNSVYGEIISHNYEEYVKGRTRVEYCYQKAIRDGSVVFSEIGVGKLNRSLFCRNAKVEELNVRFKAKRKFDPKAFFNPENMLEKKPTDDTIRNH